jgi:AraC-like DNA-binding protein
MLVMWVNYWFIHPDSREYRTYTTSADTGALLVHFKAGRSSAFFRQPMHELFGGSVLLDDLMLQSELHMLEEQLSETLTDIGKINIAEQFLISKMNPGSSDNLVLSALELIQNRKGNVSIRELLSELYVSQSLLEKRFRHIVGASPKKFTSIVRFRNIIQNYHPQTSLSALGFQAGYYDQSHFIKAFKSFTGETPEIFFGRK